MAKIPANAGKVWTAAGKVWTAVEVKQLKELAKGNTPTRVIGLKMGGTPEAIYAEASKEGIPLTPTNQSPYNRKKKS